MTRYFRLYKLFVRRHIMALMSYNTDFILNMISFILNQTIGIVFLYLIFQAIPSLNGWSFNQLLFLYGFAQLPRGIDHVITDYIWLIGRDILRGNLDKFFLRPLNIFYQIIVERFQIEGFGELIVGVALVIYSSIELKLSYSFIDILVMIVILIAGSIIYTAIKLASASICFYVKRGWVFMNLVYNFGDYSKYPLSIFGKGMQYVLLYVIPFGFAVFIPASYFLVEKNYLYSIVGPIIMAAVSFTVAYLFFLSGIKKYESSGS